MTTPSPPVSFEGFRDHLGRELRVEAPLEWSSSLGDDLELDSVELLELLVVIEDLGVFLDESTVTPEHTLGEVYLAYVAARGGEDPVGGREDQPSG